MLTSVIAYEWIRHTLDNALFRHADSYVLIYSLQSSTTRCMLNVFETILVDADQLPHQFLP